MTQLSDGEKIFEDKFIRFDRTHERDRHCMAAKAALDGKNQ